MGRAYIRGVHLVATSSDDCHLPATAAATGRPTECGSVDKSLQELQRIELPPFFHVTADFSDHPVYPSDDRLGVTDALMSSHIRYRGFQGDIRQFTAPISFDAEGMRTLLSLPEIAPWREHNGLIISDAWAYRGTQILTPRWNSFPTGVLPKKHFWPATMC
jgi:hypothetical protein